MHFSSSLSLLTNSCASLLVRPSSILSVDRTAGEEGKSQALPALRPTSPGPPLTLGSGPAQVQGDGLPGPHASSHLGPHNATQAEGRLPGEVIRG